MTERRGVFTNLTRLLGILFFAFWTPISIHARAAISQGRFRDTGDSLDISARRASWRSANEEAILDMPASTTVNEALQGSSSLHRRDSISRSNSLGWEIGIFNVNEKVSGANHFYAGYMHANPGETSPLHMYTINRSFTYNGNPVTVNASGFNSLQYKYNKTKNYRIGYAHDFYLLSGNPNKYVNPIAIRAGIDFTGDDARFRGPLVNQSNTVYSDATLNSSVTNGLSARTSVESRYRSAGAEGIAGTGYALGFLDLFLVDASVDFIYGYGYGQLDRKTLTLMNNTGTVPFLWSQEVQWRISTHFQGYRGEIGITFPLTGVAFRFYYREEQKRYYVDHTSYKSKGSDPEATANYILTGDVTYILLSGAKPLGPFPHPIYDNHELGATIRITI